MANAFVTPYWPHCRTTFAPLTALYGSGRHADTDPAALARSCAEMSNAIRDQAMRLNRMVSNLLDMARLQSEKTPDGCPSAGMATH